MKQKRPFKSVTVTKKGERWVRQPHPWVYFSDIEILPDGVESGEVVDVLSEKGTYLGSGFFNEKSKIAVRVLSANANDRYDEAFFRRRVRYAIENRLTVMGGDISNCRLIFGESDGMPGLTVDKFSDMAVTQVLSFGMERNKDMIYRLVKDELEAVGAPISGIYERNDVAIRELEGLKQGTGWYEGLPHGEETVVRISENGVLYDVDIANGQKTGFFLDQKYNRRAVAVIAKNKTVLDCFTHTGSFALNAAKNGAKKVTAVDISQSAIDMAKHNAELNGITDNIEFLCADVFELLTGLYEDGKSPYDMIILDPPAFTKSRKTVGSATRGYREINTKAMKLLPRGGYLATCSCSHFMKNELFEAMLKDAAADAGVQLRQIEMRQQGPDHPILWNVPETDYLKFYIFQVV